MTQYRTMLGGAFLASDYPEALQVAYRAYYEMADGCSTPVARHKMVIALRYAKSVGEYDLALTVFRNVRAGRLEWLTVTQRYWQKFARTPARARHHDSLAIRDKYVRCAA